MIEINQSRTSFERETEFDVEALAADIQRGIFQSPAFYGDFSMSTQMGGFNNALSSSLKFSGGAILKNDLVKVRNIGDVFRLTEIEFTMLEKRAKSISNFGNVPRDVAEDFLSILCFIDNINDMKTISEAIDVPSLNDVNILRKPEIILNLPKLENTCFIASAVEGLVNTFRKYIKTSNNVSHVGGEGVLDILSQFNIGGSVGIGAGGLELDINAGLDIAGIDIGISGAIGGGGLSFMFEAPSPDSLIGNFMSELVTGSRVPMNVIAKNPSQESPSFVGKAFFGESASSLSLVDMDQIFNKKIACFPSPSSGSSVTSFAIGQSKKFSNNMNLEQFMAKTMFGGINIKVGSSKDKALSGAVGIVNNMLGTTSGENVDLTRGDTVIPLMAGMSAVYSGLEKSPFSIDVFSEGWKDANAVANHLNINAPSFMESVKRFF